MKIWGDCAIISLIKEIILKNTKVRTRFAPSPTGFMHIGNLRTALYAYLFAKHYDGDFILRIEDTDQKRYVEGAVDAIYRTLEKTGLKHDEGPDIGGKFGPYVQSERKEIYKKYALELVERGGAYFCFCSKDEDVDDENNFGHHCGCASLSKEEVETRLKSGQSYVIRQKIPKDKIVTYHDEVYGDISVNTNDLDDQVLLKSDGMPTYNFANVIDDHLMQITHVIRGKEYIISTPKYQLLYEAFGWEAPKNIHVSTILGKDAEGNISKLSKRHGSVSFEKLLEDGYLPEAVVNYVALLGWSPKQEQEIFSLNELVKLFSADGIVKADAIFDYEKLVWMNGMYIRNLTIQELQKRVEDRGVKIPKFVNKEKLFTLLQPRLKTLNEVEEKLEFLKPIIKIDEEKYFENKYKLDKEMVTKILKATLEVLENQEIWENSQLFETLKPLGEKLGIKTAGVVWVIRIAISNQLVTLGGATELLEVLGKEESLRRIKNAI